MSSVKAGAPLVIREVNHVSNWAYWSAALREELKKPSEAIGQRVVLETPKFRVWTIQLAVGERIGFHKHNRPYFWVSHTKGKSISHFDNGSVLESEYDIGTAKNFPDLNENHYFVHDLTNIGETVLIFTTVEFL